MNRKLLFCGAFLLVAFCAVSNFAQSRKAVGAAEVNGTYRYYLEGGTKGSYDEIKILSIGRGKLMMSFELIYPYIDGTGQKSANMGSASGEATIAADTATFSMADYPECRITVKFVRPGQLKVNQKGNDTDCGFGANVSATGNYKKISRAKPAFEAVGESVTAPSEKRVEFPGGETTVVYEEELAKDGIYKFIVGAKKNQIMAIRTGTDSGEVTFDVSRNNRTIPSSVNTSKWSDKLAADGDYIVTAKRKSGKGKFKIEFVLENE